jgi:alpha-glucuronidase
MFAMTASVVLLTRCVPVLVLLMLFVSARASAETGYDLWLRYATIEDARVREAYREAASTIAVELTSPTGQIVAAELRRGIEGMVGNAPAMSDELQPGSTVLVGTPASSAFIRSLDYADVIEEAGDEGFVIRTTPRVADRTLTVIASRTEIGALYGVFWFLRLMQTGQPITVLDIVQRPRLGLRLLNHWDNLDGSIERGYAGRSLWDWNELPAHVAPRISDYARASASIGINGTVINNVNANPNSFTRPYLEKAAALARVLRPYGIRVYLSANFAAPRVLGGLSSADPHDVAVARWWRDKVAEIYRLIPDFGGFLVKANSEGQPGPQEYGRTHADGANLLAEAVGSHGGIVMWRAFVYDEEVDPDRVKRAYLEFVPLDGRFRDNVFVQVKNGPLDFQPREPFHPLFGRMPRTPLMAELQITQEYLGHSNHLVYLAPMWKEFFDADTYAAGPGSPVSNVIDGTLHGYRRTGIAGVANTGSDRNWTGHHFGQANWYAYGRLAWDPGLSAGEIAEEWIKMTWGHAPDVVTTIRSIMLDSREALVSYTMPLGLHHLIGGDHYAPMPENAKSRRADWTATYYHQANETGIGFDRTRGGSGAVDQYRSPLREQWSDPSTTPEKLLLWFHRLPWDYRLRSGRTLWDELVLRYVKGAEEARGIEARWMSLRGHVDEERHQAVLERLRRQVEDAATWRDKCLRYFHQFSKKPAPALRDTPTREVQPMAR